jgi:hypothetical protein
MVGHDMELGIDPACWRMVKQSIMLSFPLLAVDQHQLQ